MYKILGGRMLPHQRQMIEMKDDHMDIYKQQIEALKKEPSYSHPSRPIDPFEELAKTLSDLNLKEIEVKKLKRPVSEKNDIIKIFKE